MVALLSLGLKRVQYHTDTLQDSALSGKAASALRAERDGFTAEVAAAKQRYEALKVAHPTAKIAIPDILQQWENRQNEKAETVATEPQKMARLAVFKRGTLPGKPLSCLVETPKEVSKGKRKSKIVSVVQTEKTTKTVQGVEVPKDIKMILSQYVGADRIRTWEILYVPRDMGDEQDSVKKQALDLIETGVCDTVRVEQWKAEHSSTEVIGLSGKVMLAGAGSYKAYNLSNNSVGYILDEKTDENGDRVRVSSRPKLTVKSYTKANLTPTSTAIVRDQERILEKHGLLPEGWKLDGNGVLLCLKTATDKDGNVRTWNEIARMDLATRNRYVRVIDEAKHLLARGGQVMASNRKSSGGIGFGVKAKCDGPRTNTKFSDFKQLWLDSIGFRSS